MNNCKKIKEKLQALTNLVSQFKVDIAENKKQNKERTDQRKQIEDSLKRLLVDVCDGDFHLIKVKDFLSEMKKDFPMCDFEIDETRDIVEKSSAPPGHYPREIFLNVKIFDDKSGIISIICFTPLQAPFIGSYLFGSPGGEVSESQNDAYKKFNDYVYDLNTKIKSLYE